jgi:4-amino-4-deoxy-L-arabinose transferase-like glycosyltransferase
MTKFKFRKVVNIVFPFFLFLAAFLPRAIYLVARSVLWHDRAKSFIQAVTTGNWGGTLLAPHPGVMTMWLAGIGHWLGTLFDPALADKSLVTQMSVELIPLVLVISLLIVLAYFLLVRVFDRQVAAVAVLLMALDPFHIFISKTLHVDALMSVFMLISVLLLLDYIRSESGSRWRMVLLSGFLGGLALLTKTPALFLVPYLFLSLGVWQLSELWGEKRPFFLTDWHNWLAITKKILPVASVWLLVCALTYFLLWPSMWVQPGATLSVSFNGTANYVGAPHENPILFMGKTTLVDPGSLFYLVTFLINSTAVTLPAFLIGMAALFSHKLERSQRRALLLIVAFVFFFYLQMSLGGKKSERYLLPAFQFLIISAGFGVVYLLRWLAGRRQWLFYLLLSVIVGYQFVAAVSHHPYYGTHYNAILGGARTILGNNVVAGQEQGEGLDIAANYLNQLPSAKLMTVGSQINESFYRYYLGKAVYMTDDNVDYLVFARNWIVRGMEIASWGELWQSYQDRTPKFVVEFGGVPYVWIYKVGPVIDESAIEHVVKASVGDDFVLLGYDLESNQVRPGETTHLTLYWEATNKPTEDYTVFVHLLDANGKLISQQDNQPQNGMYPTSFWDAGEQVQDEYALMVDPGALAGDYTLAVGMYTLQTLQRLPVTDTAGLLLPDGLLLIKGIEILP